MSRRAWILSAFIAVAVGLVVLMFGTDLKYQVADFCRALTGDSRACYEAIAKPFETS